jgi:hypothetical protein
MSNGLGSTQNPFYSIGGLALSTGNNLVYDNLPAKRVLLPATTATYNLTANSDNRIIVALPTMTVNCTVVLPPVDVSIGQTFTVVLDADLNGVHTVFLRCNGAETVLCGQLTNRFRQFNVQQVDLTARARAGTSITAFSDGVKWSYTGVSTHDLSYQLDAGFFPQTLSAQDSGMHFYIDGLDLGTTITTPPIAGSNGFTVSYYIESELNFDLTVQCDGGANLMCATLIDKENGANDKAEFILKANAANFVVKDVASTGTWFTLYCNGERWFASGMSPQHGGFA